MNTMKKRKKNIDKAAVFSYPGIKDYYLQYAADEITDHALRESIDGRYSISINDIKDDYQLDQRELLKLLALLADDKNNIKNAEVKDEFIQLKLATECCDRLYTGTSQAYNAFTKDTFDEINHGVLFLVKAV